MLLLPKYTSVSASWFYRRTQCTRLHAEFIANYLHGAHWPNGFTPPPPKRIRSGYHRHSATDGLSSPNGTIARLNHGAFNAVTFLSNNSNRPVDIGNLTPAARLPANTHFVYSAHRQCAFECGVWFGKQNGQSIWWSKLMRCAVSLLFDCFFMISTHNGVTIFFCFFDNPTVCVHSVTRKHSSHAPSSPSAVLLLPRSTIKRAGGGGGRITECKMNRES